MRKFANHTLGVGYDARGEYGLVYLVRDLERSGVLCLFGDGYYIR